MITFRRARCAGCRPQQSLVQSRRNINNHSNNRTLYQDRGTYVDAVSHRHRKFELKVKDNSVVATLCLHLTIINVCCYEATYLIRQQKQHL